MEDNSRMEQFRINTRCLPTGVRKSGIQVSNITDLVVAMAMCTCGSAGIVLCEVLAGCHLGEDYSKISLDPWCVLRQLLDGLYIILVM